MIIKFNFYGREVECKVCISKYNSSGSTAIYFLDLSSGEIFDIITVNFDIQLPFGYCFIDINSSYGILDIIKNNDLGEFCGLYFPSGFLKYPLYKMNIEKIKKSF